MSNNFKIYEEFTPELQKIWQNYYIKATGSYNSSYEWCYTWFKHFGQDKKPFIITIVKDENVKVIAPFYMKDNRLYAIGSYPDFYDEMPILYENEEDLLELVNFIYEHKFPLNLKFISLDSAFLKFFIRKSEQERLYEIETDDYTVIPIIRKDKDFTSNMAKIYKKYLKKRETKAERWFNDKLAYNFSCDKNEAYIDEFIDLHNTRWDTLKSEKVRAFVKDLYLNHDFTFLSRLYLEKSNVTLAYDYNYLGSNNLVYFSMGAFNNEYSTLAPGFFITYNDFAHPDVPESVAGFEFGRGGSSYKYSFTNSEKMVVCLKAELSWKGYNALFELLKKIKQSLDSNAYTARTRL